jgi:hypothetical protein
MTVAFASHLQSMVEPYFGAKVMTSVLRSLVSEKKIPFSNCSAEVCKN